MKHDVVLRWLRRIALLLPMVVALPAGIIAVLVMYGIEDVPWVIRETLATWWDDEDATR
jgi:hypothetical protein